MTLRIGICAGETSGDALGAGLMDALRAARGDECEFVGIGGSNMLARGCQGLYPIERLSVVGLVEGAMRLAELLPARARLARHLIERRCDLLVGVDAPDFNLGLELAMRRAGVATVHYVSPSVWAWRSYRTRKLARAAERVLTLFPFEREFLARRGVRAEFVGHPMADEIDPGTPPEVARAALGLRVEDPVLTLLPGSRAGEIERHTRIMVGAAAWLAVRCPRLQIVAAPAPGIAARRFSALTAQPGGIRLHDAAGRAREALSAASVVLVASGTATLEALLVGRPMVVVYRTHPVTWAVGRRLLHVDHVSLPNRLAGRALVPELLQQAATPAAIGAALLRFLDDPAHGRRLRRVFDRVRGELRRGASERAAAAVLDVAARARARA